MNREKILKKSVIVCFYSIFLLTSGCLNNVSKHINNLENEDDKLTLGIVQKEIKKVENFYFQKNVYVVLKLLKKLVKAQVKKMP